MSISIQSLQVVRCRLCPKTYVVDQATQPLPKHTGRNGNHCWGSEDPGERQCALGDLPKPGVATPENMTDYE